MEYAIVVLPAAQTDLSEIEFYLTQHSSSAFGQLLTAIEKRAKTLRIFPETGRKFSSDPSEIRVSFVKGYALFYRVNEDTVEISRIINARRDLSSLII